MYLIERMLHGLNLVLISHPNDVASLFSLIDTQDPHLHWPRSQNPILIVLPALVRTTDLWYGMTVSAVLLTHRHLLDTIMIKGTRPIHANTNSVITMHLTCYLSKIYGTTRLLIMMGICRYIKQLKEYQNSFSV